ncbi:Ferredoxin, partial [Dysosmobacter welbionis]
VRVSVFNCKSGLPSRSPRLSAGCCSSAVPIPSGWLLSVPPSRPRSSPVPPSRSLPAGSPPGRSP